MEPDSENPWWLAGWFWGGVVPILPAAALFLGFVFGADKATMMVLLVVGAAPVALLFALAIIVLFGGLAQALWEDHRPTTLAIVAVVVIASYWAASNRSADCTAEANLSGQIGCAP